MKDLRDADAGEMNFAGVEAVLDERQPVEALAIEAGDLVLFRGRNSLHRVTPTEGKSPGCWPCWLTILSPALRYQKQRV